MIKHYQNLHYKFDSSCAPFDCNNIYLDTIEEDAHIKLDATQKEMQTMLYEMFLESRKDATERDKKKLSIFFGGYMGVGKTLLSVSLLNFVNSFGDFFDDPLKTGIYVTPRDIKNEAMRDGASSEGKAMISYYCHSFLLIDEIRLDMSDYEKRLIEDIIVRRNQKLLPTILIGNVGSKDLKNPKFISPHVYDRLVNEGTIFINANKSYRSL